MQAYNHYVDEDNKKNGAESFGLLPSFFVGKGKS